MSINILTFYEPYYNENYQILRFEGDNGAFIEYDPYEPFESQIVVDARKNVSVRFNSKTKRQSLRFQSIGSAENFIKKLKGVMYRF
jgi:hypothetical protein